LALDALTELEENPLAYGHRVFRLVTGLTLGNSVDDAVLRAMCRGPLGRPGDSSLEQARATAQKRVKALRLVRGELG
jgi:hypothetical protein